MLLNNEIKGKARQMGGNVVHWVKVYEECDDVPVWVSVVKVENNWRRNKDRYVGLGGTHHAVAGRYEHFGEWVKSHSQIEMPEISLNDGLIEFSNGRHRFAWFRDHGMNSLQVQIPPDQEEVFKKEFGTMSRLSQWFKTKS